MSLNGQNNTQNVLQSFLNRLQELENASWALLQAMSIGNAYGDLLNKLGTLVGEQRLGRTDADYQAGIRLRIRVNISSGRAADVLAVAALASLNSTPVYTEGDLGTWFLDMAQLPSPAYVADKLHHARAAGTYGVVQYTEVGDTAAPLVADSGYGNDVPNAGVLDSGYGGDVPNAAHATAGFAV